MNVTFMIWLQRVVASTLFGDYIYGFIVSLLALVKPVGDISIARN